MALVWNFVAPPQGDPRVSMSQAACGPFKLTVYALEPYEDRYYYDVTCPSTVTGSPEAVVVQRRGYYGPERTRAQYEAALWAQKTADQMFTAVGVIKPVGTIK